MTTAAFAGTTILSLGGCVNRPPPLPAPPAGDLALDGDRPLIDALVGGVAMRLRVDPGQWGVVELNPAAARKLSLAWQPDRLMQVGRVELKGRSAPTTLVIGSRTLPVLAAEHGRAIVVDADGLIGPDVLPYASVSWRFPAAPPPSRNESFALEEGSAIGPTAAAALPVPMRLRFSLLRDQSEATAAAGSLLIRQYGGAFTGPAMPLPILFGITRPARILRLDRPPRVAGFRIATIAVRISDFRGDNPLPQDPHAADEIVVAGRDNPQAARSWITLARDRLTACAELRYQASPRTLTLRCAFDR